MDITKEQFQAYERVRTSGVTNMWDTRRVCALSGLGKDTLLEIMQRYGELNVQYPDVRNNGGQHIDIKTLLTVAFRELRKLGYFARQNFLCCQTCAWADVPDDKANKAVFYHRQDADDLEKRGRCYLAWSGDGNEIVSVLQKHGLKTEWDGKETTRILVFA